VFKGDLEITQSRRPAWATEKWSNATEAAFIANLKIEIEGCSSDEVLHIVIAASVCNGLKSFSCHWRLRTNTSGANNRRLYDSAVALNL
jgi:hypothetical protein